MFYGVSVQIPTHKRKREKNVETNWRNQLWLSLDTINAIAPSCHFITLWHLNFIVFLQVWPCTITTPTLSKWRRQDAYLTQNCMCVI